MTFGAFAKKSERDFVPVDPCQGWVTPCKFCNKRFGEWIDADEQHLVKIPTNPGILQLAFKQKNVIEIVNVILDYDDIQKMAYQTMDDVKNIISDKKSKFTKADIICRWLMIGNEKDIALLCAHWFNYGILPKLLKSWPGLDTLQKSDSLTFSKKLQKWCYPKKDEFWKKPKPMPTKSVEVIKSCTFSQTCEICDAFFSEWERLDDVIANDKAPYAAGIYMLAIRCRERFEVIEIGHGPKIVINIKKSLNKYYYPRSQILKSPVYFRKNAFLVVRWMKFKDPESEHCCYVYAHWLNAGKELMCSPIPGEKLVGKIKNYVISNHDKKWCYETDVLKQRKMTKFKQRKGILNDLEDEIRSFNWNDT